MNPVARVGLDLVQSQRQASSLVATSMEVIQLQQRPAGLGYGRVEPKGLGPGCLGIIKPAEAVFGIPTGE